MTKTKDDAVAANQVCNIDTGACKCSDAWSGYSCESDVNECKDATICSAFDHMDCDNTIGSYICDCIEGYIKDASNVCIIGKYSYTWKGSYTTVSLIMIIEPIPRFSKKISEGN